MAALNARLPSLSQISRENEVKEKEKSVFKKMHHRDPRANDTKTLEVIGLYESNRKRMTEEMEALKEEIRYLNETVRFWIFKINVIYMTYARDKCFFLFNTFG